MVGIYRKLASIPTILPYIPILQLPINTRVYYSILSSNTFIDRYIGILGVPILVIGSVGIEYRYRDVVRYTILPSNRVLPLGIPTSTGYLGIFPKLPIDTSI